MKRRFKEREEARRVRQGRETSRENVIKTVQATYKDVEVRAEHELM